MVSQLVEGTLTEQALAGLAECCQQYDCTVQEVMVACCHQLGLGLPGSGARLTPEVLIAQISALKAENHCLNQENAELKQELVDFEILLETTTEHSDAVTIDLHGQAKAAKREIEEQFRHIAEATPVGILIAYLDDGRLIYANAAGGRILRLPSESLPERYMADLYEDPVDYQTVMAALTENQDFQDELRCVRADGQPFWGLISLRPFSFKGEAAILMTLHDVTARKQAEEALRLAEEQYRSIFENALEGIYQSTAEGSYLNVNPAMATIHGFDSVTAMLTSITEINHQVYVDETCRERFRDLIEIDGHVEGFEYQIHRRDGMIRWVSENARSVKDTNGQLLYYEGIVHDITERKQRESSLQREIEDLRVEIDHKKRSQQVAQITQTDYFQSLQAQLEGLKPFDD